MAHISSKASEILENRKKFNNGNELQSKEFADGSGLEIYDAIHRRYDPQIGRFRQIDPMAESFENYSPYTFADNNPIIMNDPLGLSPDSSGKAGFTPDNPKVEQEIVITVIKRKPADFSTAASIGIGLGFTGLGFDSYMNTTWRGPYNYKTSSGNIQSVFDTKYGKGRTPQNLGNINNYSKNARRVIRTTKFLRSASNTLVAAGLILDWGQVAYAIATDDPNKNIFIFQASGNTTVAMYGLLVPGVGWVISGTYFLGEAVVPGGWGALLDAGIENTKQNRALLGPAWNPRPGGGLAN